MLVSRGLKWETFSRGQLQECSSITLIRAVLSSHFHGEQVSPFRYYLYFCWRHSSSSSAEGRPGSY